MNRLSLLLFVLLCGSAGLNIYQYFHAKVEPVWLSGKTESAVTASSSAVLNPNKGEVNTDEQASSQQAQTDNINKPDLADALFRQAKYYEAISLYSELLKENETAALELHQLWREVIKDRIFKEQLDGVWPFLTAFLDSYPYDLKILTLKAEALAKTGKTVESIEIYYTLISNTYEIKEEEYFTARIRHLAREKIDILLGEQSWQGVIDFVEFMGQHEPDFPPYQLAHAQALINTEQINLAERILEPLLDNSYYRERALALLSEIEKARLQQTAIKLHPKGEHYLVNGVVDGENEVSLMIDTGASISVLTHSVFEQLESWSTPEFITEGRFNTAGGVVMAPIYQFERFQIGDFFVDKMRFAVMPMEVKTRYDGLLGMNFLKHFKFEIDQENNLLILSP